MTPIFVIPLLDRGIQSILLLDCPIKLSNDILRGDFRNKYKIALDRPGSGNTKNIGSVIKIDELINGKGPFAELGEDIFNDYWDVLSYKRYGKGS